MTPETTCCFSGHRPPRLPWGSNEADPRCLALKARLASALAAAYDQGYRHFLCGMAQGTDLYFCQAVLDLRQAHPDVTIEAAVPFAGQADRWLRPTKPAAWPCWTSATWKPWSSTPIPPAAWAGETGTWWTGPPSCWPFTTAPRGEEP